MHVRWAVSSPRAYWLHMWHVQVEAREALVDLLRAVFASHGAVPMGALNPRLKAAARCRGAEWPSCRVAVTHGWAHRAGSRELGFRAPGAPSDAAALLAASGARLAARHDLRSAFAAWLADRAARWDLPQLDGLRRYEVGLHCLCKARCQGCREASGYPCTCSEGHGPCRCMASCSPGCVHLSLSCARSERDMLTLLSAGATRQRPAAGGLGMAAGHRPRTAARVPASRPRHDFAAWACAS